MFKTFMIQAICRTLMHSLWQGLVFSVVTGLFLLYARRLTAATRYLVLSGLFFLLLATGGATFVFELYSLGSDQGGSTGATEGGRILSPFLYSLNVFCTEHAYMIVLVWFLVFTFRSLRMATGLAYTYRIRHSGTEQAPVFWKKKVRQLSRHLKIKRSVRLLESRIVSMPQVIGHLRPVIFIPLGLLTQLPEREIEAVLLHELAHIRRHDYFVNFIQRVAENLLFFNPGLLWISALLREERENCCDDIAIGYTGDKTTFIRALVSFKQHTEQSGGLTVAFPSRRHQLLHRVLRIAHERNKSLSAGERLFFIGSCLVLAALLASLQNPGLTSGGRLYTIPSKEQPAIMTEQPFPTRQQLTSAGEQTASGQEQSATSAERLAASTDQQATGAERSAASIEQQEAFARQLATINAEQLALEKNVQYEQMEKELSESAARGTSDRMPNSNERVAESGVSPDDEEAIRKIRQEQEDLARSQEAYDRARQDMKAKQDLINKLQLLQTHEEKLKEQQEQLLADQSYLQAKKEMEQWRAAKEQDAKVTKEQAAKVAREQDARAEKEQAAIDQNHAAVDQAQAAKDKWQMIKDKQSAGAQKPGTTPKK
jgi:bla regulator protein BlaR1